MRQLPAQPTHLGTCCSCIMKRPSLFLQSVAFTRLRNQQGNLDSTQEPHFQSRSSHCPRLYTILYTMPVGLLVGMMQEARSSYISYKVERELEVSST